MAFSYDGNDLGYDLEVVHSKQEVPVKNVQSFGDEFTNQVTYSCDPRLGQVQGNQIAVDHDGRRDTAPVYTDIPPVPAGFIQGPAGGSLRAKASRDSGNGQFNPQATGADMIRVDIAGQDRVPHWVDHRGQIVAGAAPVRTAPTVQQTVVPAARTATMTPPQSLPPNFYPEGTSPAPGRIYVRIPPTGDVQGITRVNTLWGTAVAPAQRNHGAAGGRHNANAVPAIPAGAPPSYPLAETTFRERLSAGGLNPAEVELYMQRFPSGRTRIGNITQHMQALDRDPTSREDPAHRGQKIYSTETLRTRIDTQQMQSAWTSLMAKGATPAEAVRFMRSQGWAIDDAGADATHPPVLNNRRHLDGTTGDITPEDRSDFAHMAEEVRSTQFNVQGMNDQSQRREDLNSYLGTYTTGEGRQQAIGALQRMNYMDSRGNPTGTWTHEQFGRTFYQYGADASVPPGDLSRVEAHARRDVNPASLSGVNAALSETPPNFAAAERALQNVDPLTRAVAERQMTQAYVDGTHRVLTTEPNNFSDGDARAIEASLGLRNPDGTIPASLDPSVARGEFNRLSGSGHPARDEIWSRAVQWYQQRHEDGLHRIGMNGETAARFEAGRNYLGVESELPPGTLEHMMNDHAAMEATRGDRQASDALARRFISETSTATIPQPGTPAGDQALRIQGRVQGRAGQRQDPEVEAARQRLHTSDEATRERQGRVGREERSLNQRDRELDLKDREVRTGEENVALTRERNADERERAREDRNERRWEHETRLAQEREEGQKSRDSQFLASMVGAMFQFLGAAMQAMTGVSQTATQGLASINQSTFSRFGGGR